MQDRALLSRCALLDEGVSFYSVRMYEQTLPFYLRRTVTLVDCRDEMGFGLDHEPGKAIPDIETFKQRWLAGKDAFAVMQKDAYGKFAAEGLPRRIADEDPPRIIVRKS